jgi:large subunit ribosomal protein L25
MEAVSIPANPRDDFGKGAARKARAKGLLPAIIYRAGQPATSISLDPHDLENAFRKSGNRNTLVDLGVDGSNYICLVKATQRDPLSTSLVHVDFYQVAESEAVTVLVPVEAVGKAEGEEAGGKLRLIRRDLKVSCKPGDIPATVQIDVTKLIVGDYFRVSEVVPPKGVEILAHIDFNVATVLGKRDLELEVEPPDTGEDVGEDGEDGEDGDEGADGSEGAE